MDARLVLVLAALLVDPSDAKQVFKTDMWGHRMPNERVEGLLAAPELKPEEIAKLASLAEDASALSAAAQVTYAELIELNNYEKKHCTKTELERRMGVCTRLDGVFRDYCDRCVSGVKSYCADNPYVLLELDDSIGPQVLATLKQYEADFEQYRNREGMVHFDEDTLVETFYRELDETRRAQIKQACQKYRDNFDSAVSSFEKKRSETLERLGKSRSAKKWGVYRSLAEAVVDCATVLGLGD
jgi:hypothetical protein